MTTSRFPIRLIALDIDGTLVGEDGVIGERTRRAVTEAVARGVLVSLFTGRMSLSALRFARVLGLRQPIVACQGAVIREMPPPGSPRMGRLLVHRPLSAAVAREVVTWSRGVGLEPHLNHLETMILPADDPRADDYSRFIGSRLRLVADIESSIVHPVTKVLSVGRGNRGLELLAAAEAAFEGRAVPTLSNPHFLEFVAPGVSKGRAVSWLARRLGIPLGQAMAIGDQLNDLEMIEAVGHGVAMPTAPAAVTAVARHVAPPLEDEGVAQMVERLVLGWSAGLGEVGPPATVGAHATGLG